MTDARLDLLIADAVPKGVMVGPYRVTGILGAGAVGIVHDAIGPDGVAAAVKVMRREVLTDPAAVARFEREVQALAALGHPNVVKVLGSGRLDDGRPWIATTRLQGCTLREALRAHGGCFSVAEAWAILRPIGDALRLAHASGVVHRDVKPDNVFLTGEGDGRVPVLLDFGLARVPRTVVSSVAVPALTDVGVPVGTPAYMPAEQWWNDGVGPAADQYALAATFYELVTGRTEAPATPMAAAMQHHLHAPSPSLAHAGVVMPAGGETWLARALARAQSKRFASMEDFLTAGDALFALPADPGAMPLRSKRNAVRTTALLVGVAVLPALAAAGYAGSHRPGYWIALAGAGVWPVLLAYVFVLAGMVFSRRMPVWPALVPALFGAFGTLTGLGVVLKTLRRYPVAAQFEMLNEGVSEAEANRFLGYALASGLLLASLRASEPEARAVTSPVRGSWAVASSLALLTLVAASLGAASAALVAGAGALSVALLQRSPVARSTVLARGLCAWLATALAATAALTRIDARAAALWALAPTRAARSAEVLAAAGERSAFHVLAPVTLIAVAAVAVAQVRRAVGRWPALTPRLAGGLLIALLWVGADVWMHVAMDARRAAIWSSLRPQFELFSRLLPPTESVPLPTPQVAPALQIARDVVAVDGARVGLTAGMTRPEGAAALAQDLAHALSREPHEGGVQLSVLVDAQVQWRVVGRALGVAWGVGAQRVEVLLTRGAAPRLPPSAPPEASYVLPRDFGAVAVELSATQEGAMAFSADATFAQVARSLEEIPHGHSAVLRVLR